MLKFLTHVPKKLLVLLACGVVIALLFSTAAYTNTIKFYIVTVSNKDSTKEERVLAERFLDPVIEENGLAGVLQTEGKKVADIINLDKVDLNQDGYQEILLLPSHSAFCGMQNCSFYIFDGKAVSHIGLGKSLIDVSVVPEGICILPNITNRYRDIEFQDGKGSSSIWKFGKTSYEYSGSGNPICNIHKSS